MNTNFNLFDPKNNPFLNESFSQFLGDLKTLPTDGSKFLEAHSKAQNTLNEVSHEYVECLRKIAAGQGALFADIARKASELGKNYPYSKDLSEQVTYQVAAVSEVQDHVVKNMEEGQAAMKEATKRVKKLVGDYSKEALKDVKVGAAQAAKTSTKSADVVSAKVS